MALLSTFQPYVRPPLRGPNAAPVSARYPTGLGAPAGWKLTVALNTGVSRYARMCPLWTRADDLAAVVDPVGLLQRPARAGRDQRVQRGHRARLPQPGARRGARYTLRVGGADDLAGRVDRVGLIAHDAVDRAEADRVGALPAHGDLGQAGAGPADHLPADADRVGCGRSGTREPGQEPDRAVAPDVRRRPDDLPDRVDPGGRAEVRAEVDPGTVHLVQGAQRVALGAVRPLAADDPAGRVDPVADTERVGHRAAEVGDDVARAPPHRVPEPARDPVGGAGHLAGVIDRVGPAEPATGVGTQIGRRSVAPPERMRRRRRRVAVPDDLTGVVDCGGDAEVTGTQCTEIGDGVPRGAGRGIRRRHRQGGKDKQGGRPEYPVCMHGTHGSRRYDYPTSSIRLRPAAGPPRPHPRRR